MDLVIVANLDPETVIDKVSRIVRVSVLVTDNAGAYSASNRQEAGHPVKRSGPTQLPLGLCGPV